MLNVGCRMGPSPRYRPPDRRSTHVIDLSSLKAPGWQRILAELHAPAADDRAFLVRLVAVLAQVAGSRQAVLFAVDRTEGDEGAAGAPGLAEPRPILVWPQMGEEQPEIEQGTDA